MDKYGIDDLISNLGSASLNDKTLIEKVIRADFQHLVDFFIEGEIRQNQGQQQMNIIFEPHPELEMLETSGTLQEIQNYLTAGNNGCLILNQEIEKKLQETGRWNTQAKILLMINQRTVQTLIDYYLDILESAK